MRAMAFGTEPEESLLASRTVAEIAVDVVTTPWTGNIVDARREDALAKLSTWPPARIADGGGPVDAGPALNL
jgi:2-C-methyl-D-erythritol 4-phosphate cytidylyltransferase